MTLDRRMMMCNSAIFLLIVVLSITNGRTITLQQQRDATDALAQNKFTKTQECAAYFQNDHKTRATLWRNAFINARYELSSVDIDIEWNNIFSQRMTRRIDNFFIANVSSCVYMVGGRPVWYVTIFKAGNNNIRGNLQARTELSRLHHIRIIF